MELQLLTTPSFQNDSWQVPKSTQKKLFHALNQIKKDPYTGNGHAKKCFKHQYSNVYRYRIGNYRLIYCVGKKCIKLLMVGKRADIYQRFTSVPDADVNTPEGITGVEPKTILTTHFDPPKIVDPLPGEDRHVGEAHGGHSSQNEEDRRLLAELLQEWGVSDENIELISSCSCIEDILDLDIDDDVKERVLRWNRPAKIEEIAEEPVYDLPSVEHLEKYMTGTLKGFLLKLDPDQEKVARKNLKGPTLVKGGPGTGKSLVALYRVLPQMELDFSSKCDNLHSKEEEPWPENADISRPNRKSKSLKSILWIKCRYPTFVTSTDSSPRFFTAGRRPFSKTAPKPSIGARTPRSCAWRKKSRPCKASLPKSTRFCPS